MSELTRGRSGRWLLVMIAAVLLAAIMIAITPGSAESGETQTKVTEEFSPAGVLVLSSGPTDDDVWVRYFEDASGEILGSLTAEQSFSFNRCEVTGTKSGSSDLLSLSAVGSGRGEVALVNNGFGARDKRNCSTSQGELNSGQGLTISLGSFFSDSFEMIAAEIDVEGKHNADLAYSYDNQITAADGTVDLGDEPDNDPDNAASDNVIVSIPADLDETTRFDSITIWPTGSSLAALSIEGGGDGPVEGGDLRGQLDVTRGTVIELQRAVSFVGCGGIIVEPGSDGEAATEVTVYRQDKGGCDTEPAKIEFTLDIDETGVTFDPINYNPMEVTFLVRIDWEPYADPFTPPHRRVSLDGGDIFPFVVACASQSGEGSDVQMDPDSDDTFVHPSDGGSGLEPWCLAGQQHILGSDGQWQQIQWYHGGTDPRWI